MYFPSHYAINLSHHGEVRQPISTILTLSFLCGIWFMFVAEGPLLVTKTSHVEAGNAKWDAHAFFKFTRVKSSYGKLTNSRGLTGLNVCLLSGSEANLCTINSCGALEPLAALAVVAVPAVLLFPICLCSRSQAAFLLLFMTFASPANTIMNNG